MLCHLPKLVEQTKPGLNENVGLSNIAKDTESSEEEGHYVSQGLMCHPYQPIERAVAPPNQTHQSEHGADAQGLRMDTQELRMDTQELRADTEEFMMDIAQQMDKDITEKDTQEPTITVHAADQHSGQETELSDTVLWRSQRERRPKETLTYDALGQPVQRVIELNANPLFVNVLAPAYGQYRLPWIPTQMHVYPTLVPVGCC